VIGLIISNISFLKRPVTSNYHDTVNKLSLSKYIIILGQDYLRDLLRPLFTFPSYYITYTNYILELGKEYLQDLLYSYLYINFSSLVY